MATLTSAIRTVAAGLPLAAALLPLWAGETEVPTRLPEFFVPGERIGRLDLSVPRGDLRPPEPNLGQELLALPGVAGQVRATDAMEPSIRGLGFDRVTTTLNGLPLLNGSPERTNSPAVTLGPASVARIGVTKALPSVTLGPPTTAGLIALSTTEPSASGRAPAAATTTVTFNPSRDGFMVRGRMADSLGPLDPAVTFFRNQLGDYRAADGRRVAARLKEYGASATLGWRTPDRALQAAVLHRRLLRQDAVSLPLDGKNTDSNVFTVNDRWVLADGTLEALGWRAGYAVTDPYMTSEERSAPTLTVAQAFARSFGAGVASTWSAGRSTAVVGVDYAWQNRRAIRTTAAGRDYIWPDVVQDNVGGFAEWKTPCTAEMDLRLGGRIDRTRTAARAADQPALGRPLREQYVTYNGSAAATTARRDFFGAANALLNWQHGGTLSGFAGVGVSAQPAPATERYRAFLNALGGDGHGGNAVELGNPALRPERKSALEIGASWHQAWFDVEATAYHYRVGDFILRQPIGTTAPPLSRMVVFGYRNVNADFSGAEIGVTARMGSYWSAPVTFALTRGHNRATGAELAELPPWDATVAIRYRNRARQPVALEAGGRLAGAKRNPAPFENPLFASAPGFCVWHLRAGTSFGNHVRIEAGMENVFDRLYTEYLTPPVAPIRPARGDLRPGERIPAPGRSVWVSSSFLW